MQRTVYFTPPDWDLDQGVAVSKVPGGPWRVALAGIPQDLTPDQAESLAACLFQAAAEARGLQRVEGKR